MTSAVPPWTVNSAGAGYPHRAAAIATSIPSWRQPNSIGVHFDGPASSIHDPANKRFARLKFSR